MSDFEQLNACVMDMLTIFAHMLSKHTLKKKMSADEILALIGVDPSNTAKNTPLKVTTKLEYDGDLDDMPKDIGLSKARAEAVLALCQMGVPDDHYVHSVHKKVFKPTKQHKDFYFDDNSRIAGPKGKDGKEKKVIKWLAKKAGKVGPPPEEEVVAALPPKWNGDKKKVRNMLSKVEERKKDGYINWASSREVQKKDDESKDDKIYDDNYMICGEKKDNATFLNLVAWLDEHPEIQEPEEKAEKKGKKGKKEKKAKKGKLQEPSDDDKEDSNAESSGSSSSSSSSDEDEKEDKEDKEDDSTQEMSKKDDEKDDGADSDDGDDDDSSSECLRGRAAARRNAMEDDEKDDEKDEDSSSSSDEPDTTSPKAKKSKEQSIKYATDYDEKKLTNLLKNIEKAKEEDKYANTKSTRPIKRTDALEKKFMFDEEYFIAVPNEKTEVKTSWLKKEITEMIDAANKQ